ncbi:MAG: MFS transporter [Polyangia bacterium]|jgi:MFS family permease|nr:MFS transporter [Polyangia bacterium]
MTEATKARIRASMSDNALLRWSVLLLISFAMAVNYYFYDVLSPIQEDVIKKLGFSEAEYGSIFFAYSIPMTFFLMAAMGGIIADKLGIRITGMVFFSSMVIGSFLTYYGTTDAFNNGGLGYDTLASFWVSYKPSFKMMAIGFFFFGMGAETTCVVVSKAVVKWFTGKEMATALGVNVGIARVASALTFPVGAHLSDPVWNRPILLGAILMVSGLVAFVVYLFFDVAYDRREAERKKAGLGEAEGEGDEFKLTDVFKLLVNPTYIFVALLCVTFYSGVFPFNKYVVNILQSKFEMTKQVAGTVVMFLPLAQAAITPLFGLVFDLKGKGATLMIIGSVCLAAGHTVLALTPAHPAVGLMLLGVSFSLVPAVLWPSLAKIVDQKRLGTAYGLTFTIQNYGLMVTPLLIGLILGAQNPGVADIQSWSDKAGIAEKTVQVEKVRKACEDWKPKDQTAAVKELQEYCRAPAAFAAPEALAKARKVTKAAVYDYTYPLLMLAGFGLLGLLFAFLLKLADRKAGYGLETPNKKKGPAEADGGSLTARGAEPPRGDDSPPGDAA